MKTQKEKFKTEKRFKKGDVVKPSAEHRKEIGSLKKKKYTVISVEPEVTTTDYFEILNWSVTLNNFKRLPQHWLIPSK